MDNMVKRERDLFAKGLYLFKINQGIKEKSGS
jgi:hypothetical protein